MTRREWCAKVAMLVSPAFPAEAQAALLNMLPAMSHLPNEVFTDLSVRKVAEAKRRQSVPAWDEIMGALHDYRQTFLPDRSLNTRLPRWDDHKRIGDRDLPPGPAEIQAVADKLAAFDRERAEAAIKREAAMPAGHASRPLRDVTAKGDDLRRMREARGVRLPA